MDRGVVLEAVTVAAEETESQTGFLMRLAFFTGLALFDREATVVLSLILLGRASVEPRRVPVLDIGTTMLAVTVIRLGGYSTLFFAASVGLIAFVVAGVVLADLAGLANFLRNV